MLFRPAAVTIEAVSSAPPEPPMIWNPPFRLYMLSLASPAAPHSDACTSARRRSTISLRGRLECTLFQQQSVGSAAPGSGQMCGGFMRRVYLLLACLEPVAGRWSSRAVCN